MALVFGAASSADHLRDAVSNHVEIVYEVSAADFDVSRLVVSRATTALVNLDDCELLDGVEARLQETGVAVVFNDPEISSKLGGWALARWLRHLTAKLSGNSDFDPPRPVSAQTAPVVAAAAVEAQGSVETGSAAPFGMENAPHIMERPLSPAEIESMTADFGAVQEPSVLSAGLAENAVATPASADIGGAQSPALAIMEFETETPLPALPAGAMDVAIPMPEKDIEHGDPDALDVDTEALSAMIDARLAAAEGEPVPKSPEVWRVIEGGSVSAVELPPIGPEPVAVAPAGAPQPEMPIDDTDVLKALPSLDDWQLVDPDAPVAPAPKRDEHALPALSIDFGDLELVPMETMVPIELNEEPAERWMHASNGTGGAAGKAKPATADSKGEHA
ncbi:MAG: hypothetical protein KJS83_07535 [Xanthomonadaceae bacterium]|nr:hypothetical protein [Xanthomonadaceae bacterium]